jgi:uncharacterized protein YjbI with pentapeptide repeats
MTGRQWHLPGHGLARFLWPLAALAALVIILACVLVFPRLLYPPLSARELQGVPADKRIELQQAQAKLQNDARATLLQGIGGTVLLLGAFFTYRQLQIGREQLQIAQQGQVTERFTRAIDQVGHAELDVRLGGIIALEHIANDSPGYRASIADVLTAFVRRHAPWPPQLEGQLLAHAPIEQEPELEVRAADVQEALTVLARREPPPKASRSLNLRATDLRKASLADANLQGADLLGATLQGAHLGGAQLREANLGGVHLQEANLGDANLQGVRLNGVNLQGASLVGAQLEGAFLGGAQLQGALLVGANLQKASLDHAQFMNVHANAKTIWPTGFDPRRAGVVLIDRQANTADGPER